MANKNSYFYDGVRYRWVIGHPEMAAGSFIDNGNVLYVSVEEALRLKFYEGFACVVIRLTPTDADQKAVQPLRDRITHMRRTDVLSEIDGWMRK
jgi:hypothetical protein